MEVIKSWYYLNTGTVSFDSDYQAVLDRGTTLGYTLPSSAQQTKQNTLVLALKSAGVWSLLDIFYVLATDGDRNFAKLNWKTPTSYLLTESNTPTFTTNVGFTGNGSNMRLDTGFNPSTNGVNFLQNEAGMYGYFSGTFDGMLAGTFVIRPVVFRSSTNTYYINSSTGHALGVGYSTGFYHIKRTSSTAVSIFKNGSSLNTGTSTSGTPDNTTITILQGNGSQYSNVTCGCFGVGGSLNAKESAFYTAWNDYRTSL